MKAFKLIPNMAIFWGWYFMTPLGGGVSETEFSNLLSSNHQDLQFDNQTWLYLVVDDLWTL